MSTLCAVVWCRHERKMGRREDVGAGPGNDFEPWVGERQKVEMRRGGWFRLTVLSCGIGTPGSWSGLRRQTVRVYPLIDVLLFSFSILINN
jgi:hypothetical protein